MKRVANRYLGYRLGLFTFYAFVGIPNSQCTSDADPPRPLCALIRDVRCRWSRLIMRLVCTARARDVMDFRFFGRCTVTSRESGL